MWFTHPCSYCSKVFAVYVSTGDPYAASEALYKAIVAHLNEYNENEKEHDFDDGKYKDSQEVMAKMEQVSEKPLGAIEVR